MVWLLAVLLLLLRLGEPVIASTKLLAPPLRVGVETAFGNGVAVAMVVMLLLLVTVLCNACGACGSDCCDCSAVQRDGKVTLQLFVKLETLTAGANWAESTSAAPGYLETRYKMHSICAVSTAHTHKHKLYIYTHPK